MDKSFILQAVLIGSLYLLTIWQYVSNNRIIAEYEEDMAQLEEFYSGLLLKQSKKINDALHGVSGTEPDYKAERKEFKRQLKMNGVSFNIDKDITEYIDDWHDDILPESDTYDRLYEELYSAYLDLVDGEGAADDE